MKKLKPPTKYYPRLPSIISVLKDFKGSQYEDGFSTSLGCIRLNKKPIHRSSPSAVENRSIKSLEFRVPYSCHMMDSLDNSNNLKKNDHLLPQFIGEIVPRLAFCNPDIQFKVAQYPPSKARDISTNGECVIELDDSSKRICDFGDLKMDPTSPLSGDKKDIIPIHEKDISGEYSKNKHEIYTEMLKRIVISSLYSSKNTKSN